jgi:hypothetical protein
MVTHVRYRGAFGLPFLWHHAVVLGDAPFRDDHRVCHWSVGSGAAADDADFFESAVLMELPYVEFFSSMQSNPHARGELHVVEYPPEVLALVSNSAAAQEARARSLLNRRGLLVTTDASGAAVPGYCPLSNNCEHYCTWVMAGVARSLQVERALALAGTLVSFAASLGGVGDAVERRRSNDARLSGPVAALGVGIGLLALRVAGADNISDAPPILKVEVRPTTFEPMSSALEQTSTPAAPVDVRQRLQAVPPVDILPGSAVIFFSSDGWVHVPLASLESGAAFNIEVLTPCGGRHWLCMGERHDALPLGLCHGRRLHAEELHDEAAPPFLALSKFQFRWSSRAGASPPGGLRGVLCDAECSNQRAFGLSHLRTRKFMCVGHCAEFPGTDVDTIHHLGVGGVDRGSVTLILADYTASVLDPPVDMGFALRWVEVEAASAVVPGRTFPHFVCAPQGFLPPLEPARFRFVLRERPPALER